CSPGAATGRVAGRRGPWRAAARRDRGRDRHCPGRLGRGGPGRGRARELRAYAGGGPVARCVRPHGRHVLPRGGPPRPRPAGGLGCGGGVAALDRLLRRTYVAGRGVRHALRGDAGRSWLRDQVQVAGACLAAYNATGRRRYLGVAEDLAAVLERDYADPQGGYRDVAAGDPAVSSLADRTSSVLDD